MVLILYFISYRVLDKSKSSSDIDDSGSHAKQEFVDRSNPSIQNNSETETDEKGNPYKNEYTEEKGVPLCHKNVCHTTSRDKLNVHIVPHTHDDTGWLKTVDVYFQDQVQYILSNVVIELDRNPDRRFIYVEIAFFERWWRHQCVVTKALVKKLVNSGQLQFTLGHWSMPDEAVTHYNDIITNAELGMRFLEEHFGECGKPLVAWQIAKVVKNVVNIREFLVFYSDFRYFFSSDPFGHSRAIMEMYCGRVESFCLKFVL